MLENKNIFKGRGVVSLLATFLCMAVISTSCKKKENPLGIDALPAGSELSTADIDTFTIQTYSEIEDSTLSKNPRFNLLGSYIDPVFGSYNASFYTQIVPTTLNPTFGENIKIDSFVFAMQYGGYYGELDEQTFEVYELGESLSDDSTYYTFSTTPTLGVNLVPTDMNQGTITPSPLTSTIIGEDTVSAQLRIPLDTTLARTFVTEAQTGTAFITEDAFLDYFKGVHVVSNNGMQTTGDGGVVYLNNANAASKVTIYYSEDGVSFTYDFLINNTDVDYNSVIIDNTGTDVETVLNDNGAGSDIFYAQAANVRAKIDIPSISNIPTNSIIQSATLTLPVSYYTGSNLYPSTFISMASEILAGDTRLYSVTVSDPQYDSGRKAFAVDLRQYVQQIVNGEIQNNGIVVSPSFFNTSAERIIFNGSQTINKAKPSLSIRYTEY